MLDDGLARLLAGERRAVVQTLCGAAELMDNSRPDSVTA